MVAVGLLFIATGGLCAAAFVVSVLWTAYLELTMTTAHGVTTTTSPGFENSIAFLAGGTIPIAIAVGILWTGIRMLRQGLAGLRRKDDTGRDS
jgi:hypothetical protein